MRISFSPFLLAVIFLTSPLHKSQGQEADSSDAIMEPMSNAEVLLRSVVGRPELFAQACARWPRPTSPTIRLGGIPRLSESQMSRNQFMALRAERDSVILALQVLPDDPNNHFYRFANNVLQVLCDLNAVELLPMLIQEVEKNPRAAVADTVPNDARSDSSFYYLIPTAILVLLHQEEWKVRPANDTTAQPKDVYDYVRDLYDKRGEEEKGKWEKNDVIYTVELEQDILRIAREFMNTVPEEKRKGAKGMPSSPRFR